MPPWQRTAQLDAKAGEAIPSLTQTAFTVTTQPSLILSLYAPRYCLTASAGFGRQFAKLRALSRLRRRYDSRKYRFPRSPRPLTAGSCGCTWQFASFFHAWRPAAPRGRIPPSAPDSAAIAPRPACRLPARRAKQLRRGRVRTMALSPACCQASSTKSPTVGNVSPP